MSPLKKPVVLDNDVISRLYSAGALRRALEVWPKPGFRVTEQVIDEARQWRSEGQRLVALLKALEAEGILVFISIDESSEEEIWAYARLQLEKKLGRGESASIAIACHRGFDIATDDSVAADTCKAMDPQFLSWAREPC
jgi:predicted nucleic acid-binding protein